MKKCAVFSCMGLGDGLIALVLSNNLQINGSSVTTFHPFLHGLQAWFPHLTIRPFPSIQELALFDGFYIIYEKSEWMQTILTYCERHYPHQTTVLNPIATKNRDYPYWGTGRFEGKRTFVDNIVSFCRDGLHLSLLTKDNGIRVPKGILSRNFLRRVVLHPTSSRQGKDWPKEKYLTLAENLQSHGFDPLFVLDKIERTGWDLSKICAPVFDNLEELAKCICESGYLIGNDSGIGHLASCLGLPTLTVCRSRQLAQFWRPAWAMGKVVAPLSWIPNMKFLRLRDKYWKRWVTVKRVMRNFLLISSSSEPT